MAARALTTSGLGVLATFAYDNLGRRTGLTRGNGVTTAYAYDAASRLDTLSQDMAGTGADVTFDFTHNPAGQIVTRQVSNATFAPLRPAAAATYSVNGLNQYTAINGSPLTYDGARQPGGVAHLRRRQPIGLDHGGADAEL